MPRTCRPSAPVTLSPALLALAWLAAGCSSPQPARETSATPSSTAEAPPAPSTAAPAAVASPGESPAAASAAPPSSGAASAAAAPSAAPVAEAPPAVTVKNIGMHVGGGTNDAAEKAPIKRSVDPHMESFALCYQTAFAKGSEPAKGGDFGVDLRIEKDGGKAKVSHPRTSLKAEGFKECVLGVFEAVDFEKPKGGTTTVSYSLRFTPTR